MSCVCNVAGAAPVGGVIVGASPALPVTTGSPDESDTVSFPPSDVNDANAIAATAKTAKTFKRVLFDMDLLVRSGIQMRNLPISGLKPELLQNCLSFCRLNFNLSHKILLSHVTLAPVIVRKGFQPNM